MGTVAAVVRLCEDSKHLLEDVRPRVKKLADAKKKSGAMDIDTPDAPSSLSPRGCYDLGNFYDDAHHFVMDAKNRWKLVTINPTRPSK